MEGSLEFFIFIFCTIFHFHAILLSDLSIFPVDYFSPFFYLFKWFFIFFFFITIFSDHSKLFIHLNFLSFRYFSQEFVCFHLLNGIWWMIQGETGLKNILLDHLYVQLAWRHWIIHHLFCSLWTRSQLNDTPRENKGRRQIKTKKGNTK